MTKAEKNKAPSLVIIQPDEYIWFIYAKSYSRKQWLQHNITPIYSLEKALEYKKAVRAKLPMKLVKKTVTHEVIES